MYLGTLILLRRYYAIGYEVFPQGSVILIIAVQ